MFASAKVPNVLDELIDARLGFSALIVKHPVYTPGLYADIDVPSRPPRQQRRLGYFRSLRQAVQIDAALVLLVGRRSHCGPNLFLPLARVSPDDRHFSTQLRAADVDDT